MNMDCCFDHSCTKLRGKLKIGNFHTIIANYLLQFSYHNCELFTKTEIPQIGAIICGSVSPMKICTTVRTLNWDFSVPSFTYFESGTTGS
jgi:ribulose 1,5-bisphosphate carboxylase large subunit-like protein